MTDSCTHTPGPWRFEAENSKRHPRVYAADNSLIAEVGNAVLVRWEEWDPNARLIAAAPLMLLVLAEVEAVMSIVEPRSDKHEYLATLAHVRRVIAEAKGASANK